MITQISVPNEVHGFLSSGSYYLGYLFVFEMYISGSLCELMPAAVIMTSKSLSLKVYNVSVLIEKKIISLSDFNSF